jgi:2-dehydropantoate 2-reductase
MNTPATDPILIWGAGAIGASLGAAFIGSGEEVVFVDAASDHVAAINARGLTITGPVAPRQVLARAFLPEEVAGTYRRCILAVKAHDTAAAVATLDQHVAAQGYVVSAQNGLNEEIIAARLGRERTIGCFVNFGADYLEPGVVLYGGRGAVVIGELEGVMTPRITELQVLFQTFEPAAIATTNIWGYLWAKLTYAALVFATALTNDSIADVLAEQAYRPMLTRLAREVVAVSRAEGIRLERFSGFDTSAFLPETTPAATARGFDEMVAFNSKSAKTHSGVWRDLAIRKRRTEVDTQLGPIVEAGRRHGIPTPVTAGVISRIHEIEAGRRSLGRASLEELEAITPESSS